MIPLNDNLANLKRSAIRVYTELARQTPGCIRLTLGEPDFDTPPAIIQAAKDALDGGLTHYAPNQGTEELRRAIAAYETRRGNPTTQKQVLVTVGASQALFTALMGILNPGDEVIVPVPAFPLYETIITLAGGKLVPLDVEKTGFQIDADALQSRITPRTKAILLNSPNNPTGVILNEASISAVKQAVAGNPIFVVTDNVYCGLCDEAVPDVSLEESLKGQTLLCQSFSKPYAMTGWRLGYLTGPEDVMERLLLLSAGTIASVPTFVQVAGIAALGTDVSDFREVFRRRREYATNRLRKMGLTFPEPEGAFYVFPSIRKFGIPGDEFCTRLIREAGVAAVPGICFGTEGYIRLSCCCGDAQLEEGLNRLECFVQKRL